MKHNFVNYSFTYKFYNTIMPFIYNIGAAIVIFGAMFKLLNLAGGNIMLGIGLSTEAFIFLLSAFEPKEESIDQSHVYPELSSDYNRENFKSYSTTAFNIITKKFDQWLEKASIEISLLEKLVNTMHHFLDKIANVPSFSNISEVTETYVHHVKQATQIISDISNVNNSVGNTFRSFITSSSEDKLTNYFDQIEAMAHTLNSMNEIYKKVLAYTETQANQTNTLYNYLETSLKAMEIASNEAIQFKKELALLNEKVTALNEIYAKTLIAFKN